MCCLQCDITNKWPYKVQKVVYGRAQNIRSSSIAELEKINQVAFKILSTDDVVLTMASTPLRPHVTHLTT